MKNINTILSIFVLAGIFSAVYSESVFAKDNEIEKKRHKYDKMITREAKKLKKEGWKTMGTPITEQLEITWNREFQYDTDGYPKYFYTDVKATGGSYEAAQMKADNLAKIRMAGNITTSIISLADINISAASLTDSALVKIIKEISPMSQIYDSIAFLDDIDPYQQLTPAQEASLAKAGEDAKVVMVNYVFDFINSLANKETTPTQAASFRTAIEKAKVVVVNNVDGLLINSLSMYKVNNGSYVVRGTYLFGINEAINLVKESILQELKNDPENLIIFKQMLNEKLLKKSFEQKIVKL